MSKPLIVVESPAKARTIAGFLGPAVVVESSMGHVRDLPRSAEEIPANYRHEGWARLGVDVANGFKPLYVVPKEKRAQVKKLKDSLAGASELFLATDGDREGESIAWHLLEVLSPRVPVHRMIFHEITRPAIEEAIANSRDLDRRLVDSQEARRVLDRLFGYEVSPVLWKKIMPRLSAGRVQSPALRLIVDRERARMRFRPGAWWDVEVQIEANGDRFPAVLVELGQERLAVGRDFDESGRLVGSPPPRLLGQADAIALADALPGQRVTVVSREDKPFRRTPAAPFVTSTLQQEAARKLHFSAQRTMAVAQRLYESGFITYMRTDSTSLSDQAVESARRFIRNEYGPEYLPAVKRTYKTKVRNAQEAHEAIRPAGDQMRPPAEVAGQLSSDEARLYELVFKRTIASQMTDATGVSAQLRLTCSVPEQPLFAARGRVVTFPGFLRAYAEGSDEPNSEADAEVTLPPLAVGDQASLVGAEGREHSTQPPARYTEASLVKALEEQGIGRPSTYASILATIQDRGYVWKKGTALVPAFVAFAVVSLLERYFQDLADLSFTVEMESDLDDIAAGRQEVVPWLSRFYYGNGRPGLKLAVESQLDEIDPREINTIPIGEDGDGQPIAVRVGRYGPYLTRGEDRVSVPDGLCPDELTVETALVLLAQGSSTSEVVTLGTDPETGGTVTLRRGRYGPYFQLDPESEAGIGPAPTAEVETGPNEGGSVRRRRASAKAASKSKTASLLSHMDPETVSLEDALAVLRLPREVGLDPSTGEMIVTAKGRFGPYLKRGDDTRSLADDAQIFSLTVEEALAILAQPRTRGRLATARPPLRELGPHPDSGGLMVVREGRFGPYLTDGTTNVSLRLPLQPDSITVEQAIEMISVKAAAGPVVRAAKKAPGKKAPAKVSAKKTAPTKTAPTKTAPPKKTASKRVSAIKTTTSVTAAKASNGTSAERAATERASAAGSDQAPDLSGR
jgi:DNA topoisomerase-1